MKFPKSKKKMLKMTAQFMKIHLHRPMKAQRFLIPRKNQKCLSRLLNILAFLTISHLQVESCIEQGMFLHVIAARVIAPCYYEAVFRIIEEITYCFVVLLEN